MSAGTERKWTPDQISAIHTQDVNVLVSAGAGSGKTAVLVQRVVRMMQDPERPVDIDRFLVVTFTEAAAREMRKRIGQAIAAGISGSAGATPAPGRSQDSSARPAPGGDPQGPNVARFKRQALLLNRASISTLHSFCARVLRRHFYALDLDPAFRVMDEVEATLVRDEVLERLLLDLHSREEQPGGPVGRLFARFGDLGSTARLGATISRIYAFARSQPDPHAWLEQAATDHTSMWMEQAGKTALANLKAARDSLDSALEAATKPGGPAPYVDCLSCDLSLVTAALRAASQLRSAPGCAGSWDTLRSALAEEFGRLAPAKKCDEELKETAKYLRDAAKEAWGRAREAVGPESAGALYEGLSSTKEDIQAVISLVLDFDREFSSYKRVHGLVDFADLEQMCHQALKFPDVRAAMRAEYDEVLVDECQDISPIQEAIIELVSSEPGDRGNLFMVGDVKQSIYRFRLAEPTLFMDRAHKYRPTVVAADPSAPGYRPTVTAADPSAPGTRVCLQENFRSTQSLVEALNLVFERLWIGGPAELTYTQEDRLTSSQAAGPAPEVYLVDWSSDEDGDADEEQENLTDVEREARLVAEKIAQMLGASAQGPVTVCDPDTRQIRPAQCGDVAILLRSAVDVAPVFVEALSALGIPTYAELATGAFDAVEVKVMLAALAIVDNPRQDIPLAAVLRSPLVGTGAAGLARIRACSDGDFLDAVRAAAGLEDDLGAMCRRFLAMLEEWRTLSRRQPVSILMDRILSDTRYDLICRSMVNGERRVRNLGALKDRARLHDRADRPGLQRFLGFIEHLRRQGSDLGLPASAEDGRACVRIMSVHRSKGLEFPIVFVPSLGRKWNRRDLTEEVLFHRDLGAGTLVCDFENRLKRPTLAYRAIGQRLLEGSLAEEIRVLYVALTRARERLILVGSTHRLASRLRGWSFDVRSGVLSPAGMLSATTFLDLLGPVLMSLPEGRALLGATAAPGENRLVVKCITGQQTLDEALGMPEAIPGDARLYAKQAAATAGPLPAAGIVLASAPGAADVAGFERELSNRLSWRYPFERVQGKRAKVAASEVWRLQEGETYAPSVGLFPQHERADQAAARGVATHRVLEHLDLSRTLDARDISEQVGAMAEAGKITRDQALLIDARMLAGFFASEAGRLVVENRDRASRELVFTMCVPAEEIYADLRTTAGAGDGRAAWEDEQVIVQGVIDCLLQTPSGQVVIDYKTDNVPATEVSQAAERYRWQATLYGRAAKAIGQDERVRILLWFLRPGVCVDISEHPRDKA